MILSSYQLYDYRKTYTKNRMKMIMPSEINVNNQNFFESRSLKNDFAKLVRQRIYIPLMCS